MKKSIVIYSYGLLAILFLVASSFRTEENQLTVYLIGDSTIADKEVKAYPETGWGTPFKVFFDNTVVVENRAKNGRSTRTFISENLWQPISDNLKPGDYVFIQFGHNDEAKEKVDRYTAPDDYKKNLVRFITETRSKKANPILLTPVSRRRFKDGVALETHIEYSKLVAEVAELQKVPFVDLDTQSRELYQKFGEENSKLLFLQLDPGVHPNYPEGRTDNTHFSELGARLIAQIVLTEMKRLNVDLINRVVKKSVEK